MNNNNSDIETRENSCIDNIRLAAAMRRGAGF